ncbi:hypothetical protein O9K51_11230 [Purpureocillium lavendulum]|uniref:Uncharacterized protein n=1 Tax=Purpureocillium lavendulum TaxID=1247861 RepID=A0AB34FCC0_9HYPO|nr:hypothetical protein O9K51_11230 [Purpureocillium lavendulum]
MPVTDDAPPRTYRPNIIWRNLVRLVDEVQAAVPAWQSHGVSSLQDMVGRVSETSRGNGKSVPGSRPG